MAPLRWVWTRGAGGLSKGPGLPLSWYEVLLYLEHADEGRLRMHELADSLLLSRSAATRFVDPMEAAGLVRRTVCASDRRGTFLELTPEGTKHLREAALFHLDGVARHFAGRISTEEAEVLADALERSAHRPSGRLTAQPPGHERNSLVDVRHRFDE